MTTRLMSKIGPRFSVAMVTRLIAASVFTPLAFITVTKRLLRLKCLFNQNIHLR